jgi:hypothetical protein
VTNWYDAVYGDDPSTDNIFGRETLVQRRSPLLHDYLRRGGRLGDFSRLKAASDRLSGPPETGNSG